MEKPTELLTEIIKQEAAKDLLLNFIKRFDKDGYFTRFALALMSNGCPADAILNAITECSENMAGENDG